MKRVIGAQIGEFLPVVAGHLGDQRALAVHHFVMGERQHEILAEGVEQAEGQVVVVVLAVDRLALEILQRVVHEAHVPLEAEAQAAGMNRMRDLRPGGGFLGDGDDAGMAAVDFLVHRLQEADRIEVFVAAILVRHPFAMLARIVEVEHRGDGIDAQAVEMEFLGPVERIVDEVGKHLGAAEIVDRGVPVGMEALARILMLVKRGAVEPAQAVGVGREMRRHPVEDDADADLVGAVDEAGETLRLAEAGGRRIEAGGLVAPGRIEGIFGDRAGTRYG